jgi:hypothetical protein
MHDYGKFSLVGGICGSPDTFEWWPTHPKVGKPCGVRDDLPSGSPVKFRIARHSASIIRSEPWLTATPRTKRLGVRAMTRYGPTL